MSDTPQARINAQRRIDEFFADDAVGGAMTRLERKYYEEFIAADTSELRVRAWAKARMLRDFEGELRIIQAAGEVEQIIAVKQDKKKEGLLK